MQGYLKKEEQPSEVVLSSIYTQTITAVPEPVPGIRVMNLKLAIPEATVMIEC